MEETLDMPLLVDGDDFSEARGRIRYKKRRYGLNKAVGYIPAVAAVRYVKDKRDSDDREARIASKRRKSSPKRKASASKSGSKMSVDNSVIGRLQKRKPRPTPKRISSQTQPSKASPSSKMKPLPSYLPKKQGVAANQQTQPTSNKMLWIAGGVLAVGLVAFLILRKKK